MKAHFIDLTNATYFQAHFRVNTIFSMFDLFFNPTGLSCQSKDSLIKSNIHPFVQLLSIKKRTRLGK